MNHAVYVAKKLELLGHIKTLGLHTGEDLESLREYARSVLDNCKHDLVKMNEAIACFKDLVEQCKYLKPANFKMILDGTVGGFKSYPPS